MNMTGGTWGKKRAFNTGDKKDEQTQGYRRWMRRKKKISDGSIK
jgi:hypothetical protein